MRSRASDGSDPRRNVDLPPLSVYPVNGNYHVFAVCDITPSTLNYATMNKSISCHVVNDDHTKTPCKELTYGRKNFRCVVCYSLMVHQSIIRSGIFSNNNAIRISPNHFPPRVPVQIGKIKIDCSCCRFHSVRTGVAALSTRFLFGRKMAHVPCGRDVRPNIFVSC